MRTLKQELEAAKVVIAELEGTIKQQRETLAKMQERLNFSHTDADRAINERRAFQTIALNLSECLKRAKIEVQADYED